MLLPPLAELYEYFRTGLQHTSQYMIVPES